MSITAKKGYLGELIAMALLIIKGYSIIKSRYKNKCGEIDIIARKKNTLVFVEVKSRKNAEKCYISITSQQMRRIHNASKVFVKLNSQYSECDYRYDVIFTPDWSMPIHIENVSI